MADDDPREGCEQMAYQNPFLAQLATGKPAIGCWATTAETVYAEVLGHAGYDFVDRSTARSSFRRSHQCCRRSRPGAARASSASRRTSTATSGRRSTWVRSRS